jgi:hypothetical protein
MAFGSFMTTIPFSRKHHGKFFSRRAAVEDAPS